MYLNSRYASGHVPSPPLPYLRTPEGTPPSPGPNIVIRTLSHQATNNAYVWQDGDRLDRLAEFLGLPRTSWWKILDANPQVEFPSAIKPGDILNVPPEASRRK